MENYKREDKYDEQTLEQLAYHYKEVLRLLGEDPEREGLIKTPMRVAKAWSFLTKGYNEDPIEIIRSAMFNEEYRQMVLVKDIEIFSVCEHHMLPFIGKAHVAYIPNGKITGLSKIVKYEGVATDGTNTISLPMPSVIATSVVDIYISNGTCYIDAGSDRSSYTGEVTVYYTKTN